MTTFYQNLMFKIPGPLSGSEILANETFSNPLKFDYLPKSPYPISLSNPPPET